MDDMKIKEAQGVACHRVLKPGLTRIMRGKDLRSRRCFTECACLVYSCIYYSFRYLCSRLPQRRTFGRIVQGGLAWHPLVECGRTLQWERSWTVHVVKHRKLTRTELGIPFGADLSVRFHWVMQGCFRVCSCASLDDEEGRYFL